MNRTAFICATATAVITAMLGFAGCSGNANGNANDDDNFLEEGTGAVRAAFSQIPANVRCVEIRTSDYRTPVVRTDVAPGEEAIIRVAPLSVGWVTLSGVAYDVPCSDLYPSYNGTGGAPGYDHGGSAGFGGGTVMDAGTVMPLPPDGGPYPGYHQPTWEAQETWVIIESGRTSQAKLTFMKPGGVDVDVDFRDCSDDAGGCDDPDAAPDGPSYDVYVPDYDAEPDAMPEYLPTYDAGAPVPYSAP